MSREAAAELFRLFAHPDAVAPVTVEQRIELIEIVAAEVLADLEAVRQARESGEPHRRGRFAPGDIKRWAQGHLELCAGVFIEPPPAYNSR